LLGGNGATLSTGIGQEACGRCYLKQSGRLISVNRKQLRICTSHRGVGHFSSFAFVHRANFHGVQTRRLPTRCSRTGSGGAAFDSTSMSITVAFWDVPSLDGSSSMLMLIERLILIL
jgi:hypothetical protein